MAEAKAIFVDSPNLFHMGRLLGIGELRFAALFNILTKEIGGSSACFGKPVYVLRPDQVGKKGPRLEQEGFEVVPANTEDDADDLEIVRRINGFTPDEVSEIILVSANFKDFRKCLTAKVKMGIRVIVVATKAVDEESGRPMLSVDFDEMRGDIEFVELADFKDRLMRKPLVDRSHNKRSGADTDEGDFLSKEKIELPTVKTTAGSNPTKTIILSLEVSIDDLKRIMNALSPVLQIPVIKSTLEIK